MNILRRAGIVFLLCVSLTIPVLATDTPVTTFSVPTTMECLIGDTLAIPIYVSDNQGFAGLKLSLTFDERVITPVFTDSAKECMQNALSSFPVNLGDACLQHNDNGMATLTFTLISTENMTGNGLLTTLNFRVLDTAPVGCSDLTLSADEKSVTNEIGRHQPYALQSGTLHIYGMKTTQNGQDRFSGIPEGSFCVTTVNPNGNRQILAGYDEAGKLEELRVGTTAVFENIDNRDGKIKMLKVFSVSETYQPVLPAFTLTAAENGG